MKKIFLLEEDEQTGLAIKALFEQLGHQVQCAQSGIQGIFQLRAMQPDVAFIDLKLPDVSGFEVARRLRGMPGGKDIGLIAYTDHDTAELRAQTIDAGFDYCDPLPINSTV